MSSPDTRHFLFLQGPHGPFFRQLGRMLIAAGAKVWRVGFNAGDRAFWPKDQSFIAFTGALESWETTLAALIAYPRYFDPVTGMACPVEVALERLETGDIPEMPLKTRIASEIQDLMAMLGLRR